eukprot:TRINITY_DN26767_c0_g1_i1.p1 TRINITY_DN26767_c0_g1~~TRINITY_DN26767_c0_g1_i1.p1  ORF type:complete len:112 (-),score=8.32 TRINITY_DN26767_c0_g1_i1:348-683(-)
MLFWATSFLELLFSTANAEGRWQVEIMSKRDFTRLASRQEDFAPEPGPEAIRPTAGLSIQRRKASGATARQENGDDVHDRNYQLLPPINHSDIGCNEWTAASTHLLFWWRS